LFFSLYSSGGAPNFSRTRIAPIMRDDERRWLERGVACIPERAGSQLFLKQLFSPHSKLRKQDSPPPSPHGSTATVR
jgi:hypothetical protein